MARARTPKCFSSWLRATAWIGTSRPAARSSATSRLAVPSIQVGVERSRLLAHVQRPGLGPGLGRRDRRQAVVVQGLERGPLLALVALQERPADRVVAEPLVELLRDLDAIGALHGALDRDVRRRRADVGREA